MKHEYRIIDGFQGYEISPSGDVRNIISGDVLKPWLNAGYPMVELFSYGVGKRLLIHRLVALTFLGHPAHSKMQVNHKDGVRTNCHVDNLEWVTARENMQHAHRMKLMRLPSGTAHWNGGKTHCANGHAYTLENTYTWNKSRICRRCAADRRYAKNQNHRVGGRYKHSI